MVCSIFEMGGWDENDSHLWCNIVSAAHDVIEHLAMLVEH